MLLQVKWQATIGKYIGEVQFTAGFKHPVYLFKYSFFVWRQANYAVGDNNIDTVVVNAAAGKVFDIAFFKMHIGVGIAKFFAVPVNMGAGDI